jgi:membrane protease YdiL (CAAX protease family)
MDTMKQLYSAANSLEAHGLRLMLAAHGIEANVVGDNNPWEGLASLTPSLTPAVFVHESDFEEATKLLEQFSVGAPRLNTEGHWTCRQCGEASGAQFDICWNCASPRGHAALETARSDPEESDDATKHAGLSPEDTQIARRAEPISLASSRRISSVWFEVFVVLALIELWFDFSFTIVLHPLGISSSSGYFYLPNLLAEGFAAAVVLAAIRLSREPWSTFGIVKPASLDIITGGLVTVIGVFGTSMGVDLFYDFLLSFYDKRYVHQLLVAHVSRFHVDDWTGFVSLLTLAIAVGFSEELVARGYLIQRLERLLHSTGAAVVASSLLFSLFHWNRGIFSMSSALIMGMIFGIAFAWTRRLWPVVFAHAVVDLHVFLVHLR